MVSVIKQISFFKSANVDVSCAIKHPTFSIMEFQTINIEGVEIIQLTNNDQVLFSVAPMCGARLVELQLEKNNTFFPVTWEVSAEDCKTGAWCKNEILFPFPNRIEDGQFTYEGKKYQLPVNEAPLNNAIHGMVARAPFIEIARVIGESSASLTLRHTYDGSKAYYPFAFNLDAIFSYDLIEGFKLILKVENTSSETLPFGLGWHPYFKLGKQGLEELQFDVPALDHLILGERNLPTGQEAPFEHTSLALNDWNLDDCFRLQKEGMACSLNSKTINLKMEGSAEYKYLQVFTPKDLGVVAIEPMTSGVNVFNNKEGLRLLKAGEQFEVFFKIQAT
jgi:aldose 1-epimerase